jgi:hypothetical protein
MDELDIEYWRERLVGKQLMVGDAPSDVQANVLVRCTIYGC